jgi:futalosine hydrolase
VKVLVAVDNPEILSQSFQKLEKLSEVSERLSQYKFNHIELDVLTVGHSLFETSFLMGKMLTKQKYHLVLGLGLAGSYTEEIEVGTIVNIINDKPFNFGEETEDGIKSLYALKLLNPFEAPHQRGAFINMTSAYFNVFLPYRKVPAVTTTLLKGSQSTINYKLKNFPLDVETSNGLGIHYACLFEKTNFYQLRAISYNLAIGNSNENVALQQLNETFIDILNKL